MRNTSPITAPRRPSPSRTPQDGITILMSDYMEVYVLLHVNCEHIHYTQIRR